MSKDRAEVVVSPPLLYVPPIVVGVGLHFAWLPLRIFSRWWIGVVVGVPLVVLGLVLAEWAERHLWAAGEDPKPSLPTTKLVTTGPYGFSRNPMYLLMVVSYVGLAAAVNSWWLVILLPVLVLLVDRGAIVREERHVEEVLGEAFLEYKSRVRRWL